MFLLKPGIVFMGSMGNGVKFPVLSGTFSIPFFILSYYTYTGTPIPPIAHWAMWGIWWLAVYFMVSFYFQAGLGWKALFGAIQRISSGDLTADNSNSGLSAHFGHLMHGLDSVNKNLGQIVALVRETANAVSVSASEAAQENANLSQRTEHQAATLEETASGMEELAATVKQNADNCKKADDLAKTAAVTARQGSDAVLKVVDSMTTIDKSSKRIVDIIGVIEGIAFQTNILALNAAVEAARAGEQGRGFVVVADEVRNLAQRSAAAAKEIKALIEASVLQITDGGKYAEGAGKVIGDIVVSVQQVTELIGEIAAASTEQSSGVEEINRSVIQMETVTQQNAALVEEATSSSLALQEQSDRLARLVSKFKINEAPKTQPAPAFHTRPIATPHVPAASSASPKDVVKLVPRAAPVRRSSANSSTQAATEDKWREF